MEYIKLPFKKGLYNGEDVIETIAEIKKITPDMAESLIASGDILKESDFAEHETLIGKSFGEVVALKCIDGRFVSTGKFFSPGMVVAFTTPEMFENRPKLKAHKHPKVSPKFREILRQMNLNPIGLDKR